MGEEDHDADEEGVFHDEVEIEDFNYDEETETFTYPCPCGDLFTIGKASGENDEMSGRLTNCASATVLLIVTDN